MRRIFIVLSLLAIIAFTQSCKKDSPFKPAAKVYLLKSDHYTLRETGETNAEEYTYDAKNRVTELIFAHGQLHYKYTYDSADKLTKVEAYDGGTLYSTQTYTYTGDVINIREDFAAGGFMTPKMQVEGGKVRKLLDSKYLATIAYSYDGKGNATTVNITNANDAATWTYTYDDKKHPLSMIGAANPHITFLERRGTPYTFVNNLVSSTQDGIDAKEYTYNVDGFPVTYTTHDKNGQVVTTGTYEYTIK